MKYQASRSQPARDAGVGRFVRVLESGPQVVALELEASDPRSPLGPTKGALRGVRQRGEVLRVRVPGSREARRLGKALERIVPHRVEQVVARGGAWERDGDDGLVDERCRAARHRHLVQPVVGAGLDEDCSDAPPRCTATWWSSVFSSACRRS